MCVSLSLVHSEVRKCWLLSLFAILIVYLWSVCGIIALLLQLHYLVSSYNTSTVYLNYPPQYHGSTMTEETEDTIYDDVRFETHVGYLIICSWYNLLNDGIPISVFNIVAKASRRIATGTSETSTATTTTTIIGLICKNV